MAFFNLNMSELVEPIQYTARFFALEASSEMPIIIKNKKENASVRLIQFIHVISLLKKSSTLTKHISKMG